MGAGAGERQAATRTCAHTQPRRPDSQATGHPYPQFTLACPHSFVGGRAINAPRQTVLQSEAESEG